MNKLFATAMLGFAVGMVASVPVKAQTVAEAWQAFHTPQDSCRTKVWWFHGETETTKEGITADLEAYKRAGVGGVVYYDQVHNPSDKALKAMSPEWWEMLKFAAQEARRLGLTFEINASNGYVLGGKWITKEEGMQRLAASTLIVRVGDTRRDSLVLANPSGSAYINDVAVVAIPLGDLDLSAMRSVTYNTPALGKSQNGAMNTPTSLYGVGYVERPPVGVLECSDDSVHWREVCKLPPVYGSPTCNAYTVAFAPVKASHFRARVTDPALLARPNSDKFIRNVVVSPLPMMTDWQEKAGLRSEFGASPFNPLSKGEGLDGSKIRFLSSAKLISPSPLERGLRGEAGERLLWHVPAGNWLILRIVAESTRRKSKHGRANLLGLETDKLSPRGVLKHWASYTKPIIDTLNAIGLKPIGVTMDSHEAGSQNWTQDFAEEFRKRRGYDLRPWLPAMVGYVIGSPAKTDSVLADVRLTIADLVCDRYWGTMQKLCTEEGVTLTAQANGGGLSLAADNFRCKAMVDKPQGEFWARDKDGSYDIRECASAAHRFGKPIASAEAFTGMHFDETLADMKPLADYAYSVHINEFVVCASAYQPWLDRFPGSTGGGRHYCLNRNNTLWAGSRGFWDYQARCAAMMRQGKPVIDDIIKLPSTPPTKLLGWRLPAIPSGYSWEVTTVAGDTTRMTTDGPDLVDNSGHKPKSMIWFSHRRLADGDLYFVANHSAKAYADSMTFRSAYRHAYFWNPVDGSAEAILPVVADNSTGSMSSGRAPELLYCKTPQTKGCTIPLHLEPNESGFVVITDKEIAGLPVRNFDSKPRSVVSLSSFDMDFVKEGIRLKDAPLSDCTQSDDPRIKFYSGTCAYTSKFKVQGSKFKGRWLLRLPSVNGNVRVVINGREAGTMWCSPWTLDITRFVRNGANTLRLEVTNVLANRMIGDAALPVSERVTFAQPEIYKSSDRLTPSGIFGGVVSVECYCPFWYSDGLTPNIFLKAVAKYCGVVMPTA